MGEVPRPIRARARVLGSIRDGEVLIIAASGPELANGGLSTFIAADKVPLALHAHGSEFEVLLDPESGEFLEVPPPKVEP